MEKFIGLIQNVVRGECGSNSLPSLLSTLASFSLVTMVTTMSATSPHLSLDPASVSMQVSSLPSILSPASAPGNILRCLWMYCMVSEIVTVVILYICANCDTCANSETFCVCVMCLGFSFLLGNCVSVNWCSCMTLYVGLKRSYNLVLVFSTSSVWSCCACRCWKFKQLLVYSSIAIYYIGDEITLDQMAAIHGSIGSFNSNTEDWTSYSKRRE